MKPLLLIVFSLLFASCSSLVTRSKMSAETRYKEDLIYYSGTRVNYELLSNPSKKQLFLRYVLGIPDLPLSIIMDTALLPVDFMVHEHEKTKSEKPVSLMAEIYKDTEKMLSLIKVNEFNKFHKTFVDKTDVQTSLFDVDLKNADEKTVKAIKESLEDFHKQSFDKPSYERAGRLYFKGESYLLSFRKSATVWQLSTVSAELDN